MVLYPLPSHLVLIRTGRSAQTADAHSAVNIRLTKMSGTAGVIAELSRCVTTIYSLWLAAEPEQPATAAEASPRISTRASSVQPMSPPEPGSALNAAPQHGSDKSTDGVSNAVDEALPSAEGSVGMGCPTVAAVAESVPAAEALVAHQPPGKPIFVSKEYLELALKEATDGAPPAADSHAMLNEASVHGEGPGREAPANGDATGAKVTEEAERDYDAVVGGKTAAAEGGISDGACATGTGPATATLAELHVAGSGGAVGPMEGIAPTGVDNGSDSEGIMDGITAPDDSPRPASGAVYDGASNATAAKPAPASGDQYSEAVLDGMAATDEGSAGKGFDVFGENSGVGIQELNDSFTDGTFADWDAAADDALQFGAHNLCQARSCHPQNMGAAYVSST